MKRFWTMSLAMLTMLCLAPLAQQVRAQSENELGPSIVVSIQNLDEQFNDIKHIMDQAGMGFMAGMVESSAAEYMSGIDRTQAACISLFLRAGEDKPKVVGYLPLEDMDQVLDTIADIADIDEDGDKITIVTDDGSEFQVKQGDGFAVFSDDDDLFSNAPTTPENLLGDLPTRYNLSARIYGQRIPAEMREQAVEMIRDAYENTLDQMEEDVAGAQDVDAQLKSIEDMINETEELLVGLNIDEDKGAINLDIQVVGTASSKMAKQSAVGSSNKTKFGGFITDDAAVSMNICSTMLEEDIAQVKQSIDQYSEMALDKMAEEVPAEDLEFFEEITHELMDVFQETISDGVIDMGLVGYMDASQFNIAMGSRNSNPKKFDDAIRKALEKSKAKASEEGMELEINYDDSTHAGISFHRIVVPVPDNEPEVQDVFGEKLTVLVGIGEDTSYIAFGEEPMALVTKTIDKSSSSATDLPAVTMTIAIAPIIEFAHRFQQDEALIQVAEALKENGNDKIIITSKYIKNGQSTRMEFQEGIISAFQVLGAQMGGMGEDF